MSMNNKEKYIYYQYNIDMSEMDDSKKVEFIEKENEKLLAKVLDLTFSLKTVLIKMKEKEASKPAQIFQHKNEEFKGKHF